MKISSGIKKAFTHALGKKTLEEKDFERIEFIKELIKVKKRVPKNEKDRINILKEDYYLDSITVLDNNGQLVLTTEETEQTQQAPELYSNAKKAFPNTRMIVIKEAIGYTILYSHNGLLYVFKSPGEVSPIETRMIAEKIQGENKK